MCSSVKATLATPVAMLLALAIGLQFILGCSPASPIRVTVTAEEDMVRLDWDLREGADVSGFAVQRQLLVRAFDLKL